MSLDNFQLPPFLISELFKNFLVVIDNQGLTTEISNIPEILYLGKNEKNILLIVQDENAVFLPDNDLNFLIDILKACKFSLSDTALINFHQNKEINYQSLLDKFHPEFILLFGIEPKELDFPLQFPHFQVQQYNNQTYFSAPSLNKFESDTDLKKLLWAGLQKLFSL